MRFKRGHPKAWLATGVLLSLPTGACRGSQSATPGAAGGPAFPPAAVQLVTARLTPIDDTSEYVAMLKSLRSTTIQPQIDGQITQILVRSGDRVPQGAPLLQIDPRRQEAAVSSQEASRASKEAAVNLAREEKQRASELYAAGAISRQELDRATTALQTAEADLKALQAQVQQQQVQLRYYTVTAPTSGVVGDVPVRVGMQVSTQTLLTTIDQNQTLEVYVSVPVERAAALKLGLPMTILSSDGQQTLATTSVGFVSPHVDEQTQSILVKGLVANPSGTLRSAQFVRARLVWKTLQGLTVPVTAVVRINGQYFAFVAEEANGRLVARQRAIKVGPIVGDAYPVVDGIRSGDRLVVSGVQRLVDGAPVQPS
jgi:RND family efflux transporter MFP subunit